MSWSEFHLTSDHPDAVAMIRRAFEGYALVAKTHAVQCRTRKLNPGETRERLERRAQILDARHDAMVALANQLPDGQVGPPTP